MTTIIAASLAAMASIIVAYIQVRDRSKFHEMHRQTTVNHHSSENPTIKDTLDDIQKSQKETHELIVRHIAWHLEKE